MKTDANKQNNPPNQFLVVDSNPHLSSKPYTSYEQPIEFPPYISSIPSHQPIISQINNNNSNQLDDTKLLCQKHLKELNNLFCVKCLSFHVCRTCISDQHSEHEVIQFRSYEEMLSETKEILLENLQQTLKELKRKENDVKNRTHEVNLVRQSLKVLEEEIIGIISNLFKQTQGKLSASLEKHQESFNRDIEHFFNQFNKTNDQLRETLIKILDGNINIINFNKSMIIKQGPLTPNFTNEKNILQKYKKIFKDIKNQLTSVKKIIVTGYETISQQVTQIYKASSNNMGLTKFDKYIVNNSGQRGEKVNESFMKTLKLLEIGNDKENLLLIMNKDKTKEKEKEDQPKSCIVKNTNIYKKIF